VIVSDARVPKLGEIVAATEIRRVLRPKHDDVFEPGVLETVQVISKSAIASTPPGEMVPVSGSDPAYIIYTSGSTGRPKGIVHTHASAIAYAVTAAKTYDLTSADRLANVAPLHFDQSTFELYAGPVAGAAVLVIPEPILRFPASLSALLEAERITVWYSVPYLLAQLSTRGVLAERDLGTIRWVLFGGESFPPGQLADLMGQLPLARFSNVYGPAEVNQCTIHNLSTPPSADAAVPIGRPWPGARVAVVDPEDVLVDVVPGSPGELLVQTSTMMAGYWNRPDLSAASIVERTSATGGGRRWYRTGDLVVERPDGNLEFLGRIDNQIKLRGHRIELEAIDAVLADIAELQMATVVVRRSQQSGAAEDRLIAIVVPEPTLVDGSPEQLAAMEAVVMSTLRERLPRYAVPTELLVVSSLPRTGSGKVDRVAASHLSDS
jgi:amino acid adenylation domain-containing protein